MLVPFSIFVLVALALFIQRSGVSYKTAANYGGLKLLPQANVVVANYFPDKPVEALVLYDSQDLQEVAAAEDFKNLLAVLDSMRIKYDKLDINSAPQINFTKYSSVIVAFTNLDKGPSQIIALMAWVEAGGKVFFESRPAPSNTFSIIYKKVGIISKEEPLIDVTGVEYRTDLILGGKGLSIEADALQQKSFKVQLDEKARVHLVSADDTKAPLLWDYNLGGGRVVFINSDLFGRKEARGIIGAAYSLLQDVSVYPVINSSVYFIDDFPSPIPGGSPDIIAKQYQMTVADFYVNVWMPDMVNIAKKYNLKYTGVMIETYDDKVNAPFQKQLDNERHRYFGRLALSNGWELGLHGYNHVPLCLTEAGVNQKEDYPGWPTTESMQLSVYELERFGKALFPDNTFATYVPPSNILCSGSRLWLPTVLPELKVIASVYIQGADKTSYVQEFTEASDGIIELPRILSGYDPDDVQRFAAINELSLHYVNSYFVHPDDVLDPARGALKGWARLRDQYDEYIKQLGLAAPGLRNMTAQEAAIAIQRYSRLAVETKKTNDSFEIDLGNFYDEAWLMMRTAKKAASIEGGTITPVTSDLYLIKAVKPKVIIKFDGGTP
jgi:hypothetical protein